MGWECHACPDLKLSNRPVRTRTPGGVAGVPPTMEAPYADVKLIFMKMRHNGRTPVCQVAYRGFH